MKIGVKASAVTLKFRQMELKRQNGGHYKQIYVNISCGIEPMTR